MVDNSKISMLLPIWPNLKAKNKQIIVMPQDANSKQRIRGDLNFSEK